MARWLLVLLGAALALAIAYLARGTIQPGVDPTSGRVGAVGRDAVAAGQPELSLDEPDSTPRSPSSSARTTEAHVPAERRAAEGASSGSLHLVGQLVFDSGGPAGDLRCSAMLFFGQAGPGGGRDQRGEGRLSRLETDQNGRFRTDVTELLDDLTGAARVPTALRLTAYLGEFAVFESSVSAVAGGDELDLGVLVVEERSPLVAGKVIDGVGEPAPALRVQVHSWFGVGVAPLERARLGPVVDTCYTNSLGEFRSIGSTSADTLVAVVTREVGSTTMSHVLAKGSEGVVLQLHESGELRGRIRFGVTRSDLTWDLALSPVGRARPTSVEAAASDPGTYTMEGVSSGFSMPDVALGLYDLHIYSHELLVHAWTVSDVEVTPGVCDTTSASSIELGYELPQLTFAVVGPDGEHPEPVFVVARNLRGPGLRDGGGMALAVDDWVSYGVLYSFDATLPRVGPKVDLRFVAFGYEPKLVAGISSSRTIELGAGSSMVLHVDGLSVERRAEEGLLLGFAPVSAETGQMIEASMMPLEYLGAWGIPVSIPQLGEYEFYFVREHTDESGRTMRTKLEDGATRIAITESGQAVRVALPASLFATGALND